MAKKPNFDFERREREKAKAAKKAAKAEAKTSAREGDAAPDEGGESAATTDD